MNNQTKGWKNKLSIVDCDRLLQDTILELVRVEEGYEYEDGARKGSPTFVKLYVSVVKDYIGDPDSGNGQMKRAMLTVKLLKQPTAALLDQLKGLVDEDVTFTGLTGTFYGDYGNQLSLKALDVHAFDTDA